MELNQQTKAVDETDLKKEMKNWECPSQVLSWIDEITMENYTSAFGKLTGVKVFILHLYTCDDCSEKLLKQGAQMLSDSSS